MENENLNSEVISNDELNNIDGSNIEETSTASVAPPESHRKAEVNTPIVPSAPVAGENPPPISRRQERRAAAEAATEREARIEAAQVSLSTQSQLRAAIRSGTALKGNVAAIEVLTSSSGEIEIAALVLLGKNIKVRIPFGELFRENPLDMSTIDLSTPDGKHSYANRKRQFAEKIIGAEIDFILTAVEQDDDMYLALGSRKQAMERRARQYFDGRNPLCKVGDAVDASIIAVSRHAVVAECYGVDIKIPQYLLTLQWVDNLYKFYAVGDKLQAVIKEIKREDNGSLSVALDPIACELDSAKRRGSILPAGTRVKGIVTNVYRSKGRIMIYAWLPIVELPARIDSMPANSFGRDISAGTQLRLQVLGQDEDGRIRCLALSEHGNGGMFNARPIR